MSTLQQICPSCQSRLELPLDSIGRMARCPACQHVFTVASSSPSEAPASSTATETSSASSSALDAFSFSSEPPVGSSPGASGNAGGRDSYSSSSLGSESGPKKSESFNPYAPNASIHALDRPDTVEAQPVEIDAVVNASMELYGRRFGEMIAIGAIVFGGSIFLSFAQNIFGAILQAVDPLVGGILSMVLGLVGTFAGYYLSLGTINAILALARNDVSPIGKMIVSPIPVLKFIGGLFALSVVCSPILAIGFIPLAVVQGEEGLLFSMILTGIIGVALFLLFLTFLWSWPILLVDNHPGFIAPMRSSLKISMANKAMSVIIVLTILILPLLGCMFFCIGAIFTQPLKVTIACVAYLMITGQWSSIQNAGRNYVPYAGQQPSTTNFG